MLSSISVMASANYKEADSKPVVFIFNRTWCNSGSALDVSYQLFGTAQAGSDFTGNTTGTITFAAGSFTSTLSLPVLTQGTLIDSHKTIIARINPAAEYEIATGKQFATSTITNESQPLPPTYTITQSTTSISESSILTTSVSTSNVATGTKLYFALSGTGITASDFSAGALTGEGSIDTAGKFIFSHILANDLTTEGIETLEIKLFSDSERLLQLGPTSTVTIADTSTKDSTTFVVTALNGKYRINGENRDAVTLNLLEGNVYIFDQSNASNANHPFQFSTTSNGTHGGGEHYTRGVITSGIPGTTGAFTRLSLEPGAPALYYFCKVHSGMGGQVNTVDNSTNYSYSLSKLSGLTSPNSLVLAFENYQFYNLGGNRQGIQKKGTSAIDEITGISTLTFNDTRISISDSIIGVFNQVTGKETKDAQMFRLYNASFNRFPDSDGLKYWINEYSKEITDYRKIAESFIISNEFKLRYGAANTNLEFATNMYKNILGRLPDAEGLNYWVSNLNAGTNSRVDVLGGFSESVENKNLFSQVTGYV